MTRRRPETNLEKSTRKRLKLGKSYWRHVDRDVHLGYRKTQGGGAWLMRCYLGEQKYHQEPLATADDEGDADGHVILDYDDAVKKARERAIEYRREREGLPAKSGPYRVADCWREYVEAKTNPGAMAAAKSREVIILGTADLGRVEVSKLTQKIIEGWRDKVVKTPPRRRTKQGAKKPAYGPFDDSDEGLRKRQATGNYYLALLKAALNRAYRAGQITSNRAWQVSRIKGATKARDRALTVPECVALVNASQPIEFRRLVEAALYSGARVSELARLNVRDFDADTATIHVRKSKIGRERFIRLNDEAVAYFKALTVGRKGSEPMLKPPQNGADRWGRWTHGKLMSGACKRAAIDPPVGIHMLRHAYASLSIRAGMPLFILARNLGHTSVKMLEQHYGHLYDDHYADEVRTKAPSFGLKHETNVRRLRQ